jgi:hypothetical protein
MKLTDPSRWPPGFGPLRFERLDAAAERGEWIVFSADGSIVAELSQLDDSDGALALDVAKEIILPLERCWRLHVVDGDCHVVETHVACPRQAHRGNSPRLSQFVRVWATLTVLHVVTSDEQQR